MPSCTQQGLRPFREGLDSRRGRTEKEQRAKEGEREGEREREREKERGKKREREREKEREKKRERERSVREKSYLVHQIVEHKNGILETDYCKVKTRVGE